MFVYIFYILLDWEGIAMTFCFSTYDSYHPSSVGLLGSRQTESMTLDRAFNNISHLLILFYTPATSL